MLCRQSGLCALTGPLHGTSVVVGICLGLVGLVIFASVICGLCSRNAVWRKSGCSCVALVAVIAGAFGGIRWRVERDERIRVMQMPLPAVCSAEDDFLYALSNGHSRSKLSSTTTKRGCARSDRWQGRLDQKGGVAARFTRQLGVGSPTIFYAGPLNGLPHTWPASWGRHLVFKPQSGTHSSRGVLLLIDGRELRTGIHFSGRADVSELWAANASARGKTWAKLVRGLTARNKRRVIVEEMALGLNGGPADDYKLYMFGPHVGAMYVSTNRMAPGGACYAWYGPDLQNRTDERCVINFRGFQAYYDGWRRPRLRNCRSADGCPSADLPQLAGYRICPPATTPPLLPLDARAELLAVASKLGAAVGMPFRIDLYVTPKGVLFGEFTCNPFGFQFHCAVPMVNGAANPCHLGRLHRERGGHSAGLELAKPPMFH